jgi:hypothetical protein
MTATAAIALVFGIALTAYGLYIFFQPEDSRVSNVRIGWGLFFGLGLIVSGLNSCIIR